MIIIFWKKIFKTFSKFKLKIIRISIFDVVIQFIIKIISYSYWSQYPYNCINFPLNFPNLKSFDNKYDLISTDINTKVIDNEKIKNNSNICFRLFHQVIILIVNDPGLNAKKCSIYDSKYIINLILTHNY